MPRRLARVSPFRPRRRWTRAGDYGVPARARRRRAWWREVSPIMVILPLAAFTAVFTWGGPPLAGAFEFGAPAATGRDREAAHFGRCDGAVRVNCVIDGDTFWYGGVKIRIADINTPETSEPQCAAEARLGARATERLQGLLNEGAFSLEPIDRDRDRYGRLLRTVTRDGESLGAVLVHEGLAEEWQGYRGSWC